MRSPEALAKVSDVVPGVTNTGLAALLEGERRDLLRFLSARCGDPSEAEDLLQELWLKAATVPSGPIGNGRAYLFRMANNLVLDRARARRRTMQRDRAWLDRDQPAAKEIALQADPARDAEAVLIEGEEADQVRRAIEALPAGSRRALLLYRFEGLEQSEIARQLGITRSGVEKHLSLAMKHLRRRFHDCGFFGAVPSLEQDQAGDTVPDRISEP